MAVAKRPEEELFQIVQDPGCLRNLADDEQFSVVCKELAELLESKLQETGDPRVIDGGEIWETYPRYSPIRRFPKPDEVK